MMKRRVELTLNNLIYNIYQLLFLFLRGAVLGIAYGGQPPEIIREWLTAKVEGERENG